MIYVVLPAFNEASSIGLLLEEFSEVVNKDALNCHVIVVNDGSSDATGSVISSFLRKLPLTNLTHEQNRGLAEALKTGLLHAVRVSSETDTIITMDADHSHLPGLMYRMVGLLREGYDIVIASRYRAGARIRGLSVSRRALSRCASIVFRFLFPITGVRDYTCGYRAYRAALVKRAFQDYGNQFICQNGFSCMVDILLRLRPYDPIVTEVPLVLRYDQKLSKSKMKVVKTIIETLVLILQRKKEDVSTWRRPALRRSAGN
jgi:dolichol-phosphate mannosyltransferase